MFAFFPFCCSDMQHEANTNAREIEKKKQTNMLSKPVNLAETNAFQRRTLLKNENFALASTLVIMLPRRAEANLPLGSKENAYLKYLRVFYTNNGQGRSASDICFRPNPISGCAQFLLYMPCVVACDCVR